MATITLKGTAIQTAGSLPKVGTKAPAFSLTGSDLADIGLTQFAGKKKVLNIVPSLDTSVCALSAQRFNREVAALTDTVIITISADLPFAQKRFCESLSLGNIINLSTLRAPSFGKDYGALITTGPLAGLMSRAVVVLDRQDQVVYTEQVPEITQEPDYEAALSAVKKTS